MTTQMSLRVKLTVLPVAKLAPKLTAARMRRKPAVRTTTSAANARNRDANPA